MTPKLLLPLAASAMLAAGCATVEDRYNESSSAERGAVGGALAGAAAGAILAGDGDDLEGALIGAGVGAAGGYILGNERDKRRDQQFRNQQFPSQAGAPFRTPDNRFYDSATGRYYYRDPATGATYFENGERRT